MDVRLLRFFRWSATSSRRLRLRLGTVSGLLLLAWAVSGVAYAQSTPESQNGAWDFSIWAVGSSGEEITNSFSEAQIVTAGVLVGHSVGGEMGSGWRRGRLEYAADFIPVFVQFAPHKVTGTAFDPVLLRWNTSPLRGGIAPFIELGGGGLHTSANFPLGDTSTFNFMARGGGGVLVYTRHAQALEIACRWWHISNANLGAQNPEFNGIQVSVGWHWFK